MNSIAIALKTRRNILKFHRISGESNYKNHRCIRNLPLRQHNIPIPQDFLSTQFSGLSTSFGGDPAQKENASKMKTTPYVFGIPPQPKIKEKIVFHLHKLRTLFSRNPSFITFCCFFALLFCRMSPSENSPSLLPLSSVLESRIKSGFSNLVHADCILYESEYNINLL